MKKISILLTLILTSVATTGCSALDDILEKLNIKPNNQSQVLPDNNEGGDQGGDQGGEQGGDQGGGQGGEQGGGQGGQGGGQGGGGTIVPVDPGDYYEEVNNLEGEALLQGLRELNEEKRLTTVGYSTMGTSASSPYKYTDYDPSTVRYDEKGQPYGTAIISFYSGNSMTSFNKEHVWPNTHGGNLVEADIHMPRPTIPSENGARGHSFFIEGMKSKQNEGWDPAMESFGREDYRGDSARIIFYCMIATDQLTLTDDGSRSSNTKNKEMGVISDMLSWNLRYPVLEREQRRNSGAEYLQGNRNPFIDHPEYACRIWGNYNAKTKTICGGN